MLTAMLHDARLRHVLSGAALTMGVKVAGAAAAFAFHVMLARQMGAEGYGRFSYVLSVVAMLSVVAVFGTNVVNLKYVATYVAKREWRLLSGIIYWSLRCVIITSIMISIAINVFLLFLSLDKINHSSFIIGGIIVICGSVAVAEAGILRGLRRPFSAELADSGAALRSFVSIVTLFALCGFGFKVDSPYQALAIIAASSLAVLMITTVILFYAIPKEASLRKRDYSGRQWVHTALPVCLMAIAQSIQGQVDILILSHFCPIDQVGIFSAASRISVIVGFGIASISAVMSPTIAELIALTMKAELQKLLHQTSAVTFMWAVSAFVFCYMFGKYVLLLFGPAFVDGYAVLLLLLAAQCVVALAGNLGMLMVLTGHQVAAGWIYLIIVVMNIVLDILLIPLFGIEGAAMASLLVAILSRVVIGAYLVRREGISASLIGSLFIRLFSKDSYSH